MAAYGSTIKHGTWRIVADSELHGAGWRAEYWDEADPGGGVLRTGLFTEPQPAIDAAKAAIDARAAQPTQL